MVTIERLKVGDDFRRAMFVIRFDGNQSLVVHGERDLVESLVSAYNERQATLIALGKVQVEQAELPVDPPLQGNDEPLPPAAEPPL